MSRKSRKQEAEKEQLAVPPPEPAPPEEPPQPEPEPVKASPQAGASAKPAAVQPTDEELPPPPSDIAMQTKQFQPLKTRKPGSASALKRAGVIFGKDLSTIAKHGLVGSVILIVFLMVIFYIASYAMFMLVTTSEGDDGGGNGPNLSNDGSLVADAGNDRTVSAGTVVALDSSGTTHRADLKYVEWRIDSQSGQSSNEISLYGPQVSYKFNEVGIYKVDLTVVDADWNMDDSNITVTVNPSSGDTNPPMADVTADPYPQVMYGTPVTFNGTNSTDDSGGPLNWTWTFQDIIDKTMYGPVVTYNFQSTGNHDVMLVVRDPSGNAATQHGSIQINSNGSDNQGPNAVINDIPKSVNIGDTVRLDASGSSDDHGISDYLWFVKLNNTMTKLTGQQSSFTATGFGMYDITLVARDQAGNAATQESEVLSITSGMKAPSGVTWMSTPLGKDIPFNVLTFIYGAALLSSVIFIGGLFSKGFAHEIMKGTAKTLFFAPVSVTNVFFAKMMYPLAIGPLFVFPLVLISTLPLKQPIGDVFMIALVSYLLTALVMASAAYGSCLIYVLTKRMSIKPTTLARSFMYLSLVATLSVFTGLAFLFDQWLTTDMWSGMYADLGTKLAMFSPFHQGGMLLSNMLTGTAWTLDIWVFAIPVVLIVGGIFASRKLYGDIFARE